VSGSINHPLNIGRTNTGDGESGVLQSSVTCTELGSNSKTILRMQSAQNKNTMNLIISKDALLQKEAAGDKGTIAHSSHPAPVVSEGEQRGTTEEAINLETVARQEEESVAESEKGIHEAHDSVEQKEARLAEIEHQLLSKR
jgi:hypothetical protein